MTQPEKPSHPPEILKTKALKQRGATRRSLPARPVSPGFKLTTVQKILIGAGVVLVVVVFAGYKPALRAWQVHTLDNPAASTTARKDAAERLVAAFEPDALDIFKARLTSADAGQREAVAYGLELLARKPGAREDVVAAMGSCFQSPDAAARALYAATLTNIVECMGKSGTGGTGDSKANRAIREKAAALLLPCAAPAEKDPAVRLAALKGLALLRVSGVCHLFLQIANTEKGPARAAALEGITATALPENCGELLKLVAGADPELARLSKKAFADVRDKADSAELLALVSDPSDDVRREIVLALGQRKADPKARLAIGTALRDSVPDIRLAAVRAVPTTGLTPPYTSLAERVKDPEEEIRIASAETLAQMSDDESRQIVVEAFKEDLQGKTLEAYIKTLGRRSSGKDLKAIALAMHLLDTNPQAQNSICQALIYLTRAARPEREQQRKSWTVEKWRAWYANLTAREKIKDAALAAIEGSMQRARETEDKGNVYRVQYKVVKKSFESLDKCKELCQPDDPEDVRALEDLQAKYQVVKELFFKSQSLDLNEINK